MSKHTPITDAELDNDKLVLPRQRLKTDLREARRLLWAQAKWDLLEIAPDADTEIGRYLAACKGAG
jgi:hypothetical protein